MNINFQIQASLFWLTIVIIILIPYQNVLPMFINKNCIQKMSLYELKDLFTHRNTLYMPNNHVSPGILTGLLQGNPGIHLAVSYSYRHSTWLKFSKITYTLRYMLIRKAIEKKIFNMFLTCLRELVKILYHCTEIWYCCTCMSC